MLMPLLRYIRQIKIQMQLPSPTTSRRLLRLPTPGNYNSFGMLKKRTTSIQRSTVISPAPPSPAAAACIKKILYLYLTLVRALPARHWIITSRCRVVSVCRVDKVQNNNHNNVGRDGLGWAGQQRGWGGMAYCHATTRYLHTITRGTHTLTHIRIEIFFLRIYVQS